MQRRWGLFLSEEHPAFARVMIFLQIPIFIGGRSVCDYATTKDGRCNASGEKPTSAWKHVDTH